MVFHMWRGCKGSPGMRRYSQKGTPSWALFLLLWLSSTGPESHEAIRKCQTDTFKEFAPRGSSCAPHCRKPECQAPRAAKGFGRRRMKKGGDGFIDGRCKALDALSTTCAEHGEEEVSLSSMYRIVSDVSSTTRAHQLQRTVLSLPFTLWVGGSFFCAAFADGQCHHLASDGGEAL